MRAAILIAAVILAAGCKPSSAPSPSVAKAGAQAAARAVVAADPPVNTVPTAQPGLPGLPENYWQARKQLLAQGYQPFAEGKGFRVCAPEMEGAEVGPDCPDETVLPEIEDCAGTGLGQCVALWKDPKTGGWIRIITAGEPQPGQITTVEWLPVED